MWVGIIIGLVVGLIAGYLIGKKNSTQNSESEKAANLAELKELISSSNEKITNDWAQEKLGVSDSTATRYLDELEKSGLIKQIGGVGTGVYYTKNTE